MAELAACAALIHGEAGRRAAFPATSVDIADEVRAAVAWAAEADRADLAQIPWQV
jgi:hypothetical protein